jgi:hypothetical protein
MGFFTLRFVGIPPIYVFWEFPNTFIDLYQSENPYFLIINVPPFMVEL